MAKDYTVNAEKQYADEEKRKEINAPLVEIICWALIGLKKNYDNSSSMNRVKYGYVLGQAIRQYLIPEKNWHITTAAQELWDAIQGQGNNKEDIRYFTYDEKFTAKNTNSINVNTYKGNDKTNGCPFKIKNGDKIKFNKLFICEHTTPVADICVELKNNVPDGCEQPGAIRDDVRKFLDKIHITRMLRTEDRGIECSRGRINKLKKENMIDKKFKNVGSDGLFDKIVEKFYKDKTTNKKIEIKK